MTETICVTGAAGKAGRAVVDDLRRHGFLVRATDLLVGPEQRRDSVLQADLTDYGQAAEVLAGTDAVIHLANIPAPGLATPALTFNHNITMNFNVFSAATQLGLGRVVWASSETTLGLPFDTPPRYAPVDEDHYPLPTSTYALSKVASETIAEQLAQWSGVPFLGLRFSNIMSAADYARFSSFWPDSQLRKWNLWGYIDERDVASACRAGLTAPAEAVAGSHSMIIAAADTCMNRPSAELLAEVYPETLLTREIGEYETLLAIDRAKDLLGWQPQHSWRDHVETE
ncbi:NAD-dependent epimerase/dehydratase family protein [Microlunatus parietis]|uniref:Nucleoside-diphosphate-sugar epimerase n=1 Tax=Microlunatus parietis TaxID=682979 RepID=A0A7Y9LBW5_9ACTN|nr:NAD(P)-dependent oxidoreductase [Microlunatus parietis]NYE70231.1 nucleoside-diphosphate-sugar epimerase [Microlunatus parietis]